jgi:membrane-bound lytic murein transglycosylase MltF
MKISKKQRRLLKFVIITVLVMVARPLHDSGRTQSESMVDMFHFSGKTLVCGIDLGDDMRGGHGLETGFAYEVMKDFARDHNCSIRIVTADKGADYADSLRSGVIDFLIMHHEEADADMILSDNIIDCSAFAMSHGKDGHIREINEWISEYTQSEKFNHNKALFFRTFNPIKRAEKGMTTQTVSPYDSLFRHYAKELGWDWRMLAAVVYQESKFSISSRSHR